MQTIHKKWLGFGGLALLGVLTFFSLYSRLNTGFVIGVSDDTPGQNWFTIDKFQGFQTELDPSKISNGGAPNGQNTTSNEGDRVSVRPFGYEIVGTATTTEDAITSLHTFRKRDGTNILIRSRGTYLEYLDELNDDWVALRTTSTDGAVYDFADYNINTDLQSYVYFGNSSDSFARWNGGVTNLNGALAGGEATITVDDTTGFSATGTLKICNAFVTYTGKTGTTFTGASGVVACADNTGVAQNIDEYPTKPKGNIYIVANNRLFIAGVTTTPQAVYFSKYGDALTYLTTLVTDGTAEDAGIFNLGEGGGAVTGMSQDEGATYIFKRSIIYRVTLSDSLYTLQPLKPFDGKSQTIGAIGDELIFTGGNGVYFVTPDNQIMNLSRVPEIDYPQISPISNIIKPTVDAVSFTNGSGISWKDRAYFSIKSDPDGLQDSVLVWNDGTKQWDTPITGWAVGAWIIYDNGEGEQLYFGDANTANVYKIITDEKLDNGFPFTASWRTKRFTSLDFGVPTAHLMEISSVFVEGYITENTALTISLLLDEDGYTQTFTTQLEETDTQYLFNAQPFNLFGLHPFGYLPFGTSEAVDKKKFRIYLNRDFRPLDFYNMQLEFASDEENNFWEITSIGLKVKEATQPENRNLFKQFK